jgi:hypothetical protein
MDALVKVLKKFWSKGGARMPQSWSSWRIYSQLEGHSCNPDRCLWYWWESLISRQALCPIKDPLAKGELSQVFCFSVPEFVPSSQDKMVSWPSDYWQLRLYL